MYLPKTADINLPTST